MNQRIATGPLALSLLLRRQLLWLAEQTARSALLGSPSLVVSHDTTLSTACGPPRIGFPRIVRSLRALSRLAAGCGDVSRSSRRGTRGKLAVRGSISDVRPSENAGEWTRTTASREAHKALNPVRPRHMRPQRVQIVRFVRVCGRIGRIGRTDIRQRFVRRRGLMGAGPRQARLPARANARRCGAAARTRRR